MAIVTAVALLMWIWTRYPAPAIPIFAAAYLALSGLKLEGTPPLPGLWTGLVFAAGSVLTTYCVQMTLLDPQYFARLSRGKWPLNILLVAAVYLFFFVLFGRLSVAAETAHISLVAFAFADYMVYMVRGNEITWADVPTAGTGLSVALHYKFQLHDRGVLVIMLTILYYTALHRLACVRFRNKWLPRVIAAAVVIGLLARVGAATKTEETHTWEQKGAYHNGFVLNFALSVRDSIIRAPEGYDADQIEAVAQQYSGDHSAVQNVKTNPQVKQPTIIAIMDESFADLEVLGDLQLNIDDYMPFIHSLRENTVKGYALASVFGAKTPNSEWEFMTGNSMAFLPAGSVVYNQYMKQQPTSIVSNLKNMGYTAVAMHPYFATGWRRNVVYQWLGFDEMYFLDDPEDYFDHTKTLRGYITDEEMFDKIIDRFEEKQDGEPLFVMGVTMQNHGGYDAFLPGFSTDVTAVPGFFYDANTYLTAARRTDMAVEKLISYFQKVDEPVEIVFFGDHQPSLSNAFYQTLNGKGMSGLTMDELENFFKVPFFIWTNYETPATQIDCTSLNYLSTLALERANLPLPPYNAFLAEMMQTVPAVNARGYLSHMRGGFAHVADATGEEAAWLDRYRALQYNGMFDKKHKSKTLFPYLDKETGKK